MASKIQGSQRDFSFGEVDVALKRSDDHPARKAGLRQMANMRILNSKATQNRSGRTALFPASATYRIEEITMSPGNVFKLAFGYNANNGRGTLTVFNSAGSSVFTTELQGSGAVALPWNLSNVGNIVYAQLGLSIFITFPGMRPQVVSWDGVATWTNGDYAEAVVGSQKRTPFYRLSPQGITLLPAAQTGAGINVTASSAIFTAAHVGTRIRYVNRQMLITSLVGPPPTAQCLVTIEEPLPGSQSLTFAVDPTPFFAIGDVVRGSVTGSAGLVVSVTSSPSAITVQLISTNAATIQTTFPFGQPTSNVFAFTTADTVVGPGGGLVASAVTAIQIPRAVAYWDEEVMNALRGYPASCFVDQFRLGFCNFPAVPNGISWSAINAPTDLYVIGITPSSAMFEVAPDKVQIFYVVAGPESSEFVFCDHKVYYIKIDVQTPLKPGSVSFQTLSSDGSARVQPRVTQEVILYVNSGGNSVMAVIAPGSYYRPFNTKNLCEFHSHLFTSIQALAAPNADGTFNERYLYALNSDGSMACGKYDVLDGKIGETIGWGPWSGGGSIAWIAASNADVLFTSTYSGQMICEILDDTQYLDAAMFVNNVPAPFVTGGQGPLYWIRGQAVSLMDQGSRSMGTYQVDGNGFIVPQGNAGENLKAATLVAGQPWTSMVEPFCPDATPGADVGQRMKLRRVSNFAVYVVHSTGFVLARLFSRRITRTSPALGTVVNARRFTAWNQDDDPTLPPPSRETVERIRPRGRSFDPRVAIIKDTPGPLMILEIGMEASL